MALATTPSISTPLAVISGGSNSASPNSCSPSPNLLPTPMSSSSSSERSFSGTSSISSRSSQSNDSCGTRCSNFSTARRRGYVRPQGAFFAPSAKNRESVMNLGSIAHLQYYFARTGLLDGKGGQLAKKQENGEYNILRLSIGANKVAESSIEEEGELLLQAAREEGEAIMLPPTASTYNQRPQSVASPPDQRSLKQNLVDSLENALQALESCDQSTQASPEMPTQGFYEIQGLHILDTTTLAIRAARLYYTLHPDPAKLNHIKADYQLRRDLYGVLEVLKRCAGRNFSGGIREDERLAILVWVSDVGVMIDQEARLEEEEKREREAWNWMDDTIWSGQELDRELAFLAFLFRDASYQVQHGLGSKSQADSDRTEFFRGLADGKDLILMHNAAVERSKKRFGQINKSHCDVAKPYRRAENLRFWLKAAEIRWEVKLKVDVMALVNSKQNGSSPIWAIFQDAVLQWSKVVRQDLTQDWKEEERRPHARAKGIARASPHSSPSKKSTSSCRN